MGKEPLKENTNVYFQARKRAAMSNDRLFSRENAAELSPKSQSTNRICHRFQFHMERRRNALYLFGKGR